MILRLPPGFAQFNELHARGVAHESIAPAVKAIAAQSTLYAWAAQHPEMREYQGRGPVYGAPLPDGPRVVVRHSRRGGLLGPILGDVYLPPTPAPAELVISFVLARAGVPVPPVLAYSTQRVAGILRRVDVMTAEWEGIDLRAALNSSTSAADRELLVRAVGTLIAQLTHVGAWHQDLNIKNILIMPTQDGGVGAAALDVDRVQFSPPADPNVRDANIERLQRSMRKLAASGHPAFTDEEFRSIRAQVQKDMDDSNQERAESLSHLLND